MTRSYDRNSSMLRPSSALSLSLVSQTLRIKEYFHPVTCLRWLLRLIPLFSGGAVGGWELLLGSARAFIQHRERQRYQTWLALQLDIGVAMSAHGGSRLETTSVEYIPRSTKYPPRGERILVYVAGAEERGGDTFTISKASDCSGGGGTF